MAKYENKRTEITISDVEQAIRDIDGYMKDKASAYYNDNMKKGGAPDDQL